jgi:hypothetical protein
MLAIVIAQTVEVNEGDYHTSFWRFEPPLGLTSLLPMFSHNFLLIPHPGYKIEGHGGGL